MGMKSALVERLASDVSISAIVSADIDDERAISWFGFQREDGLPAIALSIVTPGEEWTLEAPDYLDRPRVRFDLRGSDPDVLETLAQAVKAEMRATTDTADWRFHPAQLEAEREIDLGEQQGGQMLFQLQLEFMFYHEEI